MDTINELEKLAQLKEKWILSDEEFQIEKNKILGAKTHNSETGNNYLLISFSHKWRIDRIKFIVQIFLLIIYIFLFSWIIDFILSIGFFPFYINPIIENISKVLIGFLLFYLSIVLVIKRLHDHNESWWNILQIFLPFIFPIIDRFDIVSMKDRYVTIVVICYIVVLLSILIFTPWDNSHNRFWPPPK